MALEYELFAQNRLSHASIEMALPLAGLNREASFLKLLVRHQQRWSLLPGKINFVCDFQAGKMVPLSSDTSTGNAPSFVNDRFFLYNTGGYLSIGH